MTRAQREILSLGSPLSVGTEGSGGWVPPSDSSNPRDESIGQLYDLVADPAESKDLFDERPEVVRELRALLDELRER